MQQGTRRFLDRGGPGWKGPVVDYKEVELLKKFMTASSKMMSRKRAGTSASEQRDLRRAIKRARFMGLLPFTGT
jgi:small subunit ribosomal protein S18